jgi:hypothetical protein
VQRRQAEYLQAMGVDLYVHRDSAASKNDIATEPPEEAVHTQKTVELVRAFDADTETQATVETNLESAAELAQTAESPKDEIATPIEQKPEVAPTPEAEIEIENISVSPLHFLWQQCGSNLFLSAQKDQHNGQQVKLLESIVHSVASSSVEKGEGKWPLTDAQPTTKTETQEFLTSFVQGRSEQSDGDITLILFGKESTAQFCEIEGEFGTLVGQKLPAQGQVAHYRPVHSLAEMLAHPQLKALTWQSIRDLKYPE